MTSKPPLPDQKSDQKVVEIFKRLSAERPAPTTELVYRTPFELLISVILSAQMTDKGVNRATKKLFEIANTPETIWLLGEENLKSYVRSVTYFNAKAANIIKTCRLLMDLHGSHVPDTREALEALPGVGRKTASVILNTVFGQDAIAVDTHVFRVSNRTGLAPGRNVQEVEKKLLQVIPPQFLKDAHHWLVLHGRYLCTARSPKCGSCVIRDLCEYPDKNL
jgi:endonuclease-3